MEKKHFFLKSDMDGLELYVTMMIPDKKPRGIVQFSHGMMEHQIYYYDFMEFLTNHGYVTIIHDHRGHGKSVKETNDLGYFYDTTGEFIGEDLHQISKYAKNMFSNVPLFLFGQSMGSLVSFEYLGKHDDSLDKLVVCGLPSKKFHYRFGKLLTSFLILIKGDRYRSKFLNKLVLSQKNEKWLSNNKEYLEKLETDELSSKSFTINGINNLIKLINKTYAKNGWKLKNKDLKILFLAGGDDPIIINENRLMKNIGIFKKLGYKNCSCKIYDGCKHMAFIDKPEEVFTDVLHFLDK